MWIYSRRLRILLRLVCAVAIMCGVADPRRRAMLYRTACVAFPEKPLLTILVSTLASLFSMRFQRICENERYADEKEACVYERDDCFGRNGGFLPLFLGSKRVVSPSLTEAL